MANAYDKFASALQDKASEKRVPVNGEIELSERCNLNCRFCYINKPAGDRQTMADEMTTAEICKLLDEAADAGCLWMQLTGGEPLLRKDFAEIYKHAKSRGFLIRLFTNATLVSDEIADMLQKWRPFSIEVTIYGATRATYEDVTRVKGSYNRFMAGMKRLLDRRLPLTLKTCICTLNVHELEQMREIATNWGLSFRYDAELNPRLDGDRTPLEYRISPEQVVALDLKDRQRKAELEPRAKREPAVHKEAPVFSCLAGESVFHVDAYGKIGLCIMSRWDAYDWRQNGHFAEGWIELGKLRSAGNRFVASDESGSYRHCAGWSHLEEKDCRQPVGFALAVARERQNAFVPLGSVLLRRKDTQT